MAAAAAAVLPGLATFEGTGVVHYHVLLLALIALTVGFSERAWYGEVRAAVLAGISGGVAIWLTPETMPFVLMAFGALLFRWVGQPLGRMMFACAAAFAATLAIALLFDPPLGGYAVPEIDRLSCVYVALGGLLLAGAVGLVALQRSPRRAAAGLALMVALLAVWVALFPKVAMGPYGVMPKAEMQKFFGVMLELQPVRGRELVEFLAPGGLAFVFALSRGAVERQWGWLYLALCLGVSLWLGEKFILFVGFSAAAAAACLPIMVSVCAARFGNRPGLAAAARLSVLAAMLGLPEMSATAAPQAQAAVVQKMYPSCGLRGIGTLLAPAAGKIVLANVQDTPEILYRSKVETVGSLYQHGVPGYLRARAAWRAVPGGREPDAVKQTGAAYVLFCPQFARYPLVMDLPKTTLWDRLEAGAPPSWLTLIGQNAAGERLYAVGAILPPHRGEATPVVVGKESGSPRSARTAR